MDGPCVPAQSGAVASSAGVRPPILLHFDVNKTVTQSDSIQLKTIEDGIREGVAELFWGTVHKGEDDKNIWEWTKTKPCLDPPDRWDGSDKGERLVNYIQHCKNTFKDKVERKVAIKNFSLAEDPICKEDMETLVGTALQKMQLSEEIQNTPAAEEAGLRGSTLMMFASLFKMVAELQESRRPFALLFRSFGGDHERIKGEWNAFCELRHPVFSHLIQNIGKLDGSVPGVPDRRIHEIHTLYRDEEGSVLALNTNTGGPEECTWDSWAKKKPKPTTDTRNGRQYISSVLGADYVDGLANIRDWMERHLAAQGTAAIKDDWAWWQFHGETSASGKLMHMFAVEETKQLFFDDNVEHDDPRIVDCRNVDGNTMPFTETLRHIAVKVNPVEATLDDDYFLKMLQRADGVGVEEDAPAGSN